MAETTQFDVFLSYSSEDKPFVEALAKRLEDEAGFRVWLDKWHLIPGEPWQEGIEVALDQCRTYAVFLGPSGLGAWHHEEMRSALNTRVSDRKRRVIPVLLPGSNPDHLTELPRFLSQLTWVDFRGGLDDQDSFDRLVAGIKGIPPGRGDDLSAEIMASTSSGIREKPLGSVIDVPFETSGPLLSDSSVYIKRNADRKALQYLRQMHYVKITEPRQQGKTSLIYRSRGGLPKNIYTLAYVDAESLKTTNEADWYQDLTVRLIRQLQSSVKCDKLFSPTDAATWRSFLLSLIKSESYAAHLKPRLIIVIDEVGSIPVDWAEDFFRVLREVYSIREVETDFRYLTFVLAGAFDPRDLISDGKSSPFNVAQRVILEDFDCIQVGQLVVRLGLSADQTASVAERIHYWTSGQPYLTQHLCLYLAEQDDTIDADAVDAAVNRFFLEDTNHLPCIVRDLEEDSELSRYTRQAVADRVKFAPSVDPRHFRLAHVIGVIKPDEHGCCQIRNRIYGQALPMGTEPSPLAGSISPPDEYHHDVFISYSHHDKAWVRGWLLPRLERADLRVCIDFRDLEPGLPSLVNLENAVKHSCKTMIVLTPDWIASEWATFESLLIQTDDPAGRRARMIPLLLKLCEPPKRIAMLTYVDFTQPSEFEFQLKRLVEVIRNEPTSD